MMTECIFCKIVSKERPAQIYYQDEQVTAFRDIHPVAPTHLLIVPNKHLDSVNDITREDEALIGHLFLVASRLAKQEGIDHSGYRLVINTGPYAGQVVYHLHLHLIGGQRMRHGIG
jgi:histidine triad (HIT) family protein